MLTILLVSLVAVPTRPLLPSCWNHNPNQGDALSFPFEMIACLRMVCTRVSFGSDGLFPDGSSMGQGICVSQWMVLCRDWLGIGVLPWTLWN